MSSRGFNFSAYGLRTLWAAAVVLYLALWAWSVVNGQPMSGTDFGAGFGALFTLGGAGVKIHETTRPPL